MTAHDLMTAEPAVVTPIDTTVHAARLMTQFDVGMLPVVDDLVHRRLVGVITDRDIVIRCLGKGHLIDCRIEDHMTDDPLVVVTPDATAETIVAQMERFQVRRVPVIDGATRTVVGVITLGDLARQIGHTHPQLVERLTERIYTPGALVP